ncbi:uncharacterized protein METZ01_LOCUS349493, partial [marine metagenome]
MTPFLRQPIPHSLYWIAILLPLYDTTLADSAAESDWRVNNDAGQCRGDYEEPVIDSGTAIQAS